MPGRASLLSACSHSTKCCCTSCPHQGIVPCFHNGNQQVAVPLLCLGGACCSVHALTLQHGVVHHCTMRVAPSSDITSQQLSVLNCMWCITMQHLRALQYNVSYRRALYPLLAGRTCLPNLKLTSCSQWACSVYTGLCCIIFRPAFCLTPGKLTTQHGRTERRQERRQYKDITG